MELSKRNKKYGYFVTGIDTGVGKTRVAIQLMHQFRERGLRVAGFKPIASGAKKDLNGWIHEDVQAMQAAATVDLPNSVVNPYCFEPPIAPVIAAVEQGTCMTVNALMDGYKDNIQPYVDAVVVEGAGGWIQPLNEHESMSDLACALRLPVVIVVSIRLGCLNHALLTYQSIQATGLPIAGWYANIMDPTVERIEEQIMQLQKRLACPLLETIPYQRGEILDEHKNLRAEPLSRVADYQEDELVVS
jgi:dethiobiotin synthetase